MADIESILVFEVKSAAKLRTKADAAAFFRVYAEQVPELLPEKYDFWEPLRRPFSMKAIDEITREPKLEYPIYLKRTKPNVEGSVDLATRILHGHATLRFALRHVDTVRLAAFLRVAAMRCEADVAMLTAMSEREWARPDFRETVGSLQCGLGTSRLRKYFPQLPWAMVFGPPYVRLFGKERLLSAPCYSVNDLGPETVYLQLTAVPTDVQTDFDAYEAKRQEVKAHLGIDAFYDATRGEAGPYRTPKFALEDPPPPRPGMIAGRKIIETPNGLRVEYP